MGRFRKGDIIVNLWTEKDSPIHRGIYTGNGSMIYPYKGIYRTTFDPVRLENDTEHFVKVGYCPIEKLFKEMLDLHTDNKEI